MKNDAARRLPAEWENGRAVLLSWPHAGTDWNYMLEQAQDCYYEMVKAIAPHARILIVAPDTAPVKARLSGIEGKGIFYFDVPTNDTWIRDFGPITVEDSSGKSVACDFGFNGWGGKFRSDLDNAVNRHLKDAGMIRCGCDDQNSFILEGGSIESDGQGTILTTASCLLTPTRNASMTKEDIEAKLCDTLGARKILWLDKGEILGDDTDGHIDTIARLAPHDTILYCTKGNNESDPQDNALGGVGESLSRMQSAAGLPYNLIGIPMPSPIYDPEDGHRLPATYANFLIINDAVILPTYGQPDNDRVAELCLRVAFPEHIIEKVDCRALIRQHGSLHCATMQIPDSVLNL